jgi:RHS repeat-associated protein
MAMSVVYTTVNGQILSESRGGTVSHFVPDPLGSVVMVRDTSGNTVYEAEYDPYGNVQSETGTNPSSLGYIGTLGYIKDSASSMYVRARYLLNNLGRWLTKDPLWPSEAGYVYAGAAPSIWVDSSGTSPQKGRPVKNIPDRVHKVNPRPGVHHPRPPQGEDPCSCPLNRLDVGSHYGYVFIDCSCKGKDFGVLPETCLPTDGFGCDELDDRPKCGQWIPADAVQINGVVYKIFFQSCVVFTCKKGGISGNACCRLPSMVFGLCVPKPTNDFDDRRLRRTPWVQCIRGRVE